MCRHGRSSGHCRLSEPATHRARFRTGTAVPTRPQSDSSPIGNQLLYAQDFDVDPEIGRRAYAAHPLT